MKLETGTVHEIVAEDIRRILEHDAAARSTWQRVSDLARNEWLCFVESPKKPETRLRRLERMRSQLANGQTRPCCWQGCPHREKNGR